LRNSVIYIKIERSDTLTLVTSNFGSIQALFYEFNEHACQTAKKQWIVNEITPINLYKWLVCKSLKQQLFLDAPAKK
jgi:hypothetical protein